MGRVTGHISSMLERRIVTLSEKCDFDTSRIKTLGQTDTIKYGIVNDPFIELKILNEGSFEIVAKDEAAIADCLICDFIIGQDRRKQQYINLQSLINKGTDYNPAWPLITAYYCAFFCAIDIARLLNKININFTTAEMSIIKSRISGDRTKLDDFNNFSGTISSSGNKIKFYSTGSKPHFYAWDNLFNSVIKRANSEHADWPELMTLTNILSGSKNWDIPSNIRNTWNYRDPSLFQKNGNSVGLEFKKIIENSGSSEQWLTSNTSSKGLTHHAASIAILCEILFQSANSAYEVFEIA